MSPKEEWFEKQKTEMLTRRRRVVFNNDGGDAVLGAPDLALPRDFLNIRTTALQGSHVDTISYSTASGFGTCTHASDVFQTLIRSEGRFANTAIPKLLEQGTDSLGVMVEYCKDNGLEIFWSMRMNDTHDSSRAEWFKQNRFKSNHPQYLLGTDNDRPMNGGWSAVNYGCEQIRDMAVRFIREVCEKYDIDGVELDFFRHPVFFTQTSRGRPVGDEEREQMTDLMRRIAAVIGEEGRARGRPFIVAVRAPDDVDYCGTIGLEIERWMQEGLIDVYIPSAYIQLNDWEYSIQLGHRYGVQVYPGLSESRVGGGHHADCLRASDECYRARALTAWTAGADGIYLFNLFDPHRRIWGEMGEPDVLGRLNKIYFASVRGVGRVAGGAYPHEHFQSIPTVSPDAPMVLDSGARETIRIHIGENPAVLSDKKPEIKLCLKIRPTPMETGALTVVFNGREVCGEACEEWLEHAISPNYVRRGVNTVEICCHDEHEGLALADIMVAFNYSGSLLQDNSYIRRTRERM